MSDSTSAAKWRGWADPSHPAHRPATGYTKTNSVTHPPFEAGNTSAVTHGAHSERVVTPVAQQRRADLVARAEWLTAPPFVGVLDAVARTEARLEIIERWLDEQGGLIDPNTGKIRPAAEFALKLERLLLEQYARAGLDPRSYVQLQASIRATKAPFDLTAALDHLDALEAGDG